MVSCPSGKILHQEKIEILKQIFPDFFIRKGEEFVCYCPKHSHHKKKLEISLVKNNFSCWVCKWSGPIFKIFKEHGTKTQANKYYSLIGYTPETTDETTEKIKLPEEYCFLLDAPDNQLKQMAINYLSQHEITEDIIVQNKIGICFEGEFRNRIIFPSFDENGQINFFTARTLVDSNLKYWAQGKLNQIVFNELFLNWDEPLILVESVKTYCRHSGAVSNIVCLNGCFVSKKYELFRKIIINGCPLVYIGFDPEAEEESVEAIRKFSEYNIPVKQVNFKKQPDEISSDEFISCIEQAKELDKFDSFRQRLRSAVK